MVRVSVQAYDADSDLIQSTAYADATDSYTTCYEYDPRDRLTGTLTPDGVATILTLDNAGDATETDTYGGSTYSSGIVTGALGAKTTASYRQPRPSLRNRTSTTSTPAARSTTIACRPTIGTTRPAT